MSDPTAKTSIPIQSRDDGAIRAMLAGLFVAARVHATGPKISKPVVEQCFETADLFLAVFLERYGTAPGEHPDERRHRTAEQARVPAP